MSDCPERGAPETGREPETISAWLRPRAIAPAWHTIVLGISLLVFALATAHSQHQFSRRHGPVSLYLVTMAWEWLMVGYIVWGVRREGVRLRELVGGRWRRTADVLLDVAIGIAFWLLAAVVLAGIGYAMGLANPRDVSDIRQRLAFMLPRNHLELALFLLLSATAGFCEEIIFRAYLLRQLAAATGSLWAGLFLQALLFAAGHGYEGGKRMGLIAVYGVMFGLLAFARRTLRPGMFAHALQDAVAGVMMRAFR